jgi:prevent-host-death family protein
VQNVQNVQSDGGFLMIRKGVTEVRSSLSDALNRAAYAGERVVVHRHGKDIAAVVPIEDLRLLQELEDRFDLEDARAALKETKKKGTISWKKIKTDLGL